MNSLENGYLCEEMSEKYDGNGKKENPVYCNYCF